MTKGTIGLNAGIIRNLIEDNESLSFDSLKQETSLSDADLWSAIGWLARENRIEIDNSLTSPVFTQGTNFYY